MKKIMLLAMLGLFLLADTVTATEARPVAPLPEGVWIKLTLIFHRPKFQCQSGFGLCADFSAGIEAPAGNNSQDACLVRARLNEKNQLVVEIAEQALKSYNSGMTLPYFRDKGSITIQDPYTLSPATCRLLGSSIPITVKPGEYPVTFTNGVYTVVFQL